MATKLKNMKLTSVDLVRAGANQEADICLFKSADHVEAAEEPSEDEKNIFKRFLDWIRKNATEAENEPQSHAEKQEESIDSLKDLYKSALAQSLDSIQKDDRLTDAEKKSMSEMSREQYNRKLKELHDLEEEEDRLEHELGDDHDDRHEDPKAEIKEELMEEINDDDDRYDEIDEIPLHKFNQNHGADGKFSSAGGGGGGGAAGGLSSKAEEILNAGGFDKAYKVADLVNEMKIGDSVTCKDYKKGDIMEFKRVGNADTIAAFQNVRGKNHMASPQQVASWVKDSVLYADYNPTFKEGATKKSASYIER